MAGRSVAHVPDRLLSTVHRYNYIVKYIDFKSVFLKYNSIYQFLTDNLYLQYPFHCSR